MALLLEKVAKHARLLLPQGPYLKRLWVVAVLSIAVLWMAITVMFATSGPPFVARDLPPNSGYQVLKDGFHVRLKNQHNQDITETAFLGHPTAVFFGFTYCPQVCPTTLASLASMMKQLGPRSNKIHVIFVSIDPERDTTSLMSDYLGSFDTRFIGLTGSATELDKLANAFGAYVKRIPLDDGGYTYDHTAIVYLLNSKAELSGTIAFDETPAVALSKMKQLIDNN